MAAHDRMGDVIIRAVRGRGGGVRRVLGRAALAVGAVVVFLGAAEFALRLLMPQTLPLEGLLREDPVVGLRHVPGFHGRLRTERYDTAVAINSEGYRDREYPPKGSAFRVLGLGDSFAFGYGVEEPESYLSRLEAMAADRGVEVIDAGHPSMGPDNEALLLEADGPRLRPDLVLVGIYVGNDVWNVLTGPRRAIVVDGVLRSGPGVLEQWYRPLRADGTLGPPLPAVPASDALKVPLRRWIRRSHLFRFLSRRYAALRSGDGPRPLTVVDDAAVFVRDEPKELGAGWDEVCAWLSRMSAWCAAHGAKLAVLLIPTAEQVDPRRWAETRQRFGLREADIDLAKPQRRLGECARAQGLPVIDVLPALRAAAAQGGPDLYFPSDPHWTPRAHEIAARELLRELRAQQFLP